MSVVQATNRELITRKITLVGTTIAVRHIFKNWHAKNLSVFMELSKKLSYRRSRPTTTFPISLQILAHLRYASLTLTCLQIATIGAKINIGAENLASLKFLEDQSFRLRYVGAVDYRMYRLNGCSPWYDDSLSHYIQKLVVKLRLQIKSYRFDPADSILAPVFLTTFKLACDLNRNHEGTAVWAIEHFVADGVDISLNHRMDQSKSVKNITTTVESNRTILQEAVLRFYPKVVSH